MVGRLIRFLLGIWPIFRCCFCCSVLREVVVCSSHRLPPPKCCASTPTFRVRTTWAVPTEPLAVPGAAPAPAAPAPEGGKRPAAVRATGAKAGLDFSHSQGKLAVFQAIFKLALYIIPIYLGSGWRNWSNMYYMFVQKYQFHGWLNLPLFFLKQISDFGPYLASFGSFWVPTHRSHCTHNRDISRLKHRELELRSSTFKSTSNIYL